MEYQNINTERQFKDATGYSKSDFKLPFCIYILILHTITTIFYVIC